MLKKLTLFLFLLVLSTALLAQSRYVMRPNGELIKINANSDVQSALKDAKLTDAAGNSVKSVFPQHVISGSGILDTLSYYDGNPDSYTSRFGFTGQDVMFTWYVAPAEMVIKGIGFKAAADDVLGDQVSIRLLKFSWSEDDLMNTGVTNMGYYPSDGDGFGNQSAFPEDATGDWVDLTDGEYPTPPWDNPDYDLWSDFGFGWPVEPIGVASDDPAYQWVVTGETGLGEPTVQQGDIFAIAITHDGTILDDERIGFWTMDGDATGIYSWKFYENGRNTTGGAGVGDGGWWAREYTFDFVVAVDLVGDRAPVISNVTSLGTTLSQDARTVSATITDDNPSGGPAGIASAELIYTLNSGAEQTVAMTAASGDVYSGDIPGMAPGDTITYYVKATDVEGLSTSVTPQTYQIYKPTPGVDVLVVVNDGSARVGLLLPYYFDLIGVIQAKYDVWSYGQITADLINNYSTIFEIQMAEAAPSSSVNDYTFYADWLAEGGKNFLLAGQEALGYLTGYADSAFVPGDFEYDYLGVAQSYNDVTYAASGDQNLPSTFYVQPGTLLGDSLAAYVTADDTLFYDPYYNVDAANWLDQFDPRTDISTEVFMHGVALDGTERPVGQSWTDANGNKIVFMSYDPLHLFLGLQGDWIATASIAPFHQAVQWFGLNVVGVRNVDGLAKEFNLAQNYPNPFNPSTTIKYSLTENAKVSLKVYDILGKEVATLINESQAPGSYEFDFNASNLASGMYIYTLRAGDFVSSKKMMLLK